MSNPIIKIEGISKKYRLGTKEPYYSLRDSFVNVFKKKKPKEEFWALEDINFEVEQGETIGIIGRNGAGKSTLLKILSRITPPTKGKITMRGRVASLLEVGTGFNPELTGRENIYLNGAILGMTKKEIGRKFNEIVAFSEIEKFLDTPVKRYSSGMYVRLAFAVAAHLEPEILIVDEVLAVGDANFQKKCLGKMNDVSKKDGRTVLFVSHNMGAVEQLCEKCVWIENGRMKEIGESVDVIGKYLELAPKTSDNNLAKKKGIKTVFRILNKDGIEVVSFKSGEKITFIFESTFDFELDKVSFNVVLVNNSGMVAATILGRDQLKNKVNISSFCRCNIDWSNNFLAPGDYNVKISIYSQGGMWVDWDNVAVLTIAEADYFNTGEIIKKNPRICVLPKCEWNIEII